MTIIVTRAGKGSELTWNEVDANFTNLQATADDADTAAIAALATTGLIARTGSGTAATRTMTGTTNQVTVTNGDGVSGNPTFSLPQNIHSGATPTFAGLTNSALTSTRVVFAGASGVLTDNANFTYTVGTGLYVADTTASTSSTTGAIRTAGGIGAAGAINTASTITAKGATHQFGDSALASQIEYQIISASGYRRSIRFMTGANGRWLIAANTAAESGSDSGCQFTLTAYSDGGSALDNVFEIVRASGGTISLGTTSRPVEIATTANGAKWIHGSSSELLTLSTAGTTTDTSANLLPANAVIEAVVARVTTTITTATSWQLGDPTTAGRFTNANSTMTAGTTDIGLKHQQGSIATDATGPVQTAAAKVRVTTVGTPGAGAIRITVFYRQFVAPTS